MPKPEIHSWLITGTSPLIQSNPHSMWAEPEEELGEAKPTRRKKPMYAGKTEAFRAAEDQLYRENGTFHHPGMAFFGALLLASRQRTLGKLPATDVVILGVRVIDQQFVLCHPSNAKKPLSEGWLVDKRRAVNHNKNEAQGGVAVVAIRPKWNEWAGILRLEIDVELFTGLEGLTDLLNIAGVTFGIGVGRRRISGIRNRRELWSDCGLGRFTAKLLE